MFSDAVHRALDRLNRLYLHPVHLVIRCISALLVFTVGYTLGTGAISAAIKVDFLPASIPLLTGPGFLFVLLAVTALTKDVREQALQFWYSLNFLVAYALSRVLVALNYAQLWATYPAVFLILTTPGILYAVSAYTQRQRSAPFVNNLLADTADFINTVPIRPGSPERARELQRRYNELRRHATQSYPGLDSLFTVLHRLFPEDPKRYQASDFAQFETIVRGAIADLSGVTTTQGRYDDILTTLLAGRLHLHLARQGADFEHILRAHETLSKLGDPDQFRRESNLAPVDRNLLELWENSWAAVYVFCAEHKLEYERFAIATGAPMSSPEEFLEKARRAFARISRTGADHSRHRAINNLADLEFKRFVIAARDAPSHGRRARIPSDLISLFMASVSPPPLRETTNVTSSSDSGEGTLKRALQDLSTSLRTAPTVTAMVTYAQVTYVLAHADAFRYDLPEISELERAAALENLRDRLNTTVDYLLMAVICGFDRHTLESKAEQQTLLMDRLLVASDEQLAPLRKEIRLVFVNAHHDLARRLARIGRLELTKSESP